MRRIHFIAGVAIGLIAAFAILAFVNRPGPKPSSSGPILSECDGRMRELVIQYEPAAKPIVSSVYRQFLNALDASVTVHVVCPDQIAFADLRSIVGTTRCQLAPIFTHHPITTWSRDRWVALTPVAPGTPITLLSPCGEAAAEVWPARAGDEKVGQDIAAALGPSIKAVRSRLYFDGGDFLADGDNVFVVPRVLPRNIQHTAADRCEFLRELDGELKRHIILIDSAPDHHAGMFMASIGNGTVVVGDPAWGGRLLPPGFDSQSRMPGGPDLTAPTRHLFDAVAKQCAACGYRVLRIPTVPSRDQKTYLTYVNVLLDRDQNRRIVYMPVYQGVDALNETARGVWESLGFEVRPIDCTATYRCYGCLHCLVNVLKRG